MRAVIFDLWDTLVDWPARRGRGAEASASRRSSAARPRTSSRRGATSYRASQTGPLRGRAAVARRPRRARRRRTSSRGTSSAAQFLRLREGAREAIAELRRRGARIGLITVCSEEVPAAWPETELAGLFDAETFSSECGLVKPEPEIYLRTAEALGVEAADCFFVGDGANDELAGAERVGMTSVLFAPPGRAALAAGARVGGAARVVDAGGG